MNKLYVSLAACLLSVAGLSSCQKTDIENNEQEQNAHSVTFNVNVVDNTKTALTVKVVPNWKNTSKDDISLYENEKAGSECAITTGVGGDYEKATFTATFSGTESPYSYRGVVAQKDGENFIIPDVQKPGKEELIDPRADFLIGDSKREYTSQQSDIEMYFSRPIALSRLAITNIEGEKVVLAKISSNESLAGSTTYSNIDFAKGTATFTDGSKDLTLCYGEDGVEKSNTFYAYFISLPGTKTINTVQVATEDWLYTKNVAKATDFTANEFKNIALDMTIKEGTTKSPYFIKNGLLVTEDSFDFNEGEYTSPKLKCPEGATISFKSSEGTVATVSNDGAVTPLKEGETTITATFTVDETEYDASYTLTISGTAPTTTFYLATEMIAGESYVLVNGYSASKQAICAVDSESKVGSLTIDLEEEGQSTIKINDKVVSSLEWTVTNDFNLKNGSYYLYRNSSDENRIYQKTTTDASCGVCSYDGSFLKLNGYYVYYSTGGTKDWKSKETSTPNTSYRIQLYSKLQYQTLTFSPTSVEYDADDPESFEEPELTGAKTDVTYSSNSTKVSVDENTGEITVNDTENDYDVTITATAVGTSEYRSAKAEYTLSVKGSAPKTTTTFYLVSEMVNGESYLIVNANNAIKVASSTSVQVGTLGVTESDNKIEISNDDVAKVEWTVENSSTAGKFYLKNGVYYLYTYKKSNNYLVYQGSKSSSNGLFQYDGTDLKLLYNNDSYKNVYYSSTNGWKTSSDSKTIKIYSKKQPQTLTFSSATATYDVENPGEFVQPILSGAKTTVTYSSSDETKVKVNASTGAISVESGVNKATVTITATAAGDATYSSASASYTLNVKNSSIVEYYKKVNSIPSEGLTGSNYLIVYETSSTSAYVFKGVYSGTVDVPGGSTLENKAVLDTDNAVQVELTTDGIKSTSNVDDCALEIKYEKNSKSTSYPNKCSYRLGNGKSYYVRLNGGDGTLCAQSSGGYRPAMIFSGTGNNLLIVRNPSGTDEGSDDYSMWFDTSVNRFVCTSTTDNKVSLYQLAVEE